MFRTDFLKSLSLRCVRFEYCPEVTALISLAGVKIPEIAISYKPRQIHEGKKIRWHDGFGAIWTLIKYRFRKNFYFYVFLLALTVRIILFFINLNATGNFTDTIHGQDGYYELGRNLFLGNGFSINPEPPYLDYSYGVPGYPGFLYFTLLAAGGSYGLAVALQILLGSFVPVIGMYLTKALVPFKKAPVITGILLALAPYQILFSFIFYTETLFIVLFGIFLILFFKFLKNPTLHLTVWTSVFLALSTLTKPTVQYYIALVPLFVLWHFRKEIKIDLVKKLIYFILVFFILISPWLYRNWKTFDQIALSGGIPFNMYQVLLPSVLSIANNTSFVAEKEKLSLTTADIFYNPPENLTSQALMEIRKHPMALVKVSMLNAFTFFTHDGMLTFLQASKINPVSYLPRPASVMLFSEPLGLAREIGKQIKTPLGIVLFARIFWLVVTMFFFIGILALWRRKFFTHEVLFAILTVFYFMGTTLINGLTVNARFRMPVESLIFIIAYAGVIFIYTKLKRG